MTETGCHLFQEVKASRAPAVQQVGGPEGGKEVPRKPRIIRLSRAIKINLQRHQLTQRLVAGEATNLNNNLHHLEITINAYKTPLSLTFATMQM